MRIVQLDTLDALRGFAAAWDDLWWRSDATLPTARAETVAQWIEHFAPRAAFRALAVVDQGQWVAALPLIGRRLKGWIPAGQLPNNEWAASGELLLDPHCDADAALERLAAALPGLPWPVLWLDEIRLDAARWRRFHGALAGRGIGAEPRHAYDVARLEIGPDWEDFASRWPRKHRQKMARSARRIAELGGSPLVSLADLLPRRVETWLRRGFEIEDRSWKGRAGSSVLRTPGMFAFFLRQAEQLAEWGQLDLEFLLAGDREIAFAYGAAAKGVFHSSKIGYDPQYAALSPGLLLEHFVLRRFHAEEVYGAVDFLGPITAAHRAWRPDAYTVGRWFVAVRGLSARAALGAYRRLWPRLRRVSRRGDSQPAGAVTADRSG
jgi:CelD/BcsL family acetyltransferase involved in cellulose biosynthesis